MITEAAEARLMRETIDYQADILLERLADRWRADVKSLVPATLLAAHINEHGKKSEA